MLIELNKLNEIWNSENSQFIVNTFPPGTSLTSLAILMTTMFHLLFYPWNLKLIFNRLNQYSNDHCELQKKKIWRFEKLANGLL